MVIKDIQEVAQYLEVKFRISMRWKDPRVTFYNIKPHDSMNSLTLDEQLALWTPTVVFWNTKDQLRYSMIRTHSQASDRRARDLCIIGMEINEDIDRVG